jgi:hypothetical protein
MQKSKQVLVRLTEAEKKALQDFAANHQTTVSDVIRHNLFEYDVRLPAHVKATATHYPVKGK